MPRYLFAREIPANPGNAPPGFFGLIVASSYAGVAVPQRVLHLLSQRPSLTGSGITLDAMVRHAAHVGWDQRVVVGVPHDDPAPAVGELSASFIHPLRFGTDTLPFDIPGMSDVMPYQSSRFSALTPEQIEHYKQAWCEHLAAVARESKPDVIHTHHLWIMSSLVREVFPRTPVVAHCHGTCLRQMELCPHLAPEAIAGCQRLDRYAVLHEGHAVDLVRKLGVERKRIDIVGAGFRDDLFHIRGRKRERGHDILYAGKFSNAKGLPWLLDAFEQVQRQFPGARLHIAGGGSGQEAGDIRARMETMAPHVVLHGMLSQAELSELMRRCDLFVLPSFYEGLPLVLIEALASGCRLVSTNLPCMDQLREHIAPALDLVKLPRLVGPDTPVQDDLPRFITNLCEAITLALTRPSIVEHAALHKAMVEPYTWDAVCIRTESVWRRLIGTNAE